jgi:hypothetical protein
MTIEEFLTALCSTTMQKELTVAFPLQQWLHEHATVLCHMYITYLVFFFCFCHGSLVKHDNF